MADVARLFPVRPSQGEGGNTSPDAMFEAVRIAEALLFASTEPLEEKTLDERMPDGVRALDALEELRRHYSGRGINLVRVAR